MTSPNRLSRMAKKRRARGVVAPAKDDVNVGMVERLGYTPVAVPVVTIKEIMASDWFWDGWGKPLY